MIPFAKTGTVLSGGCAWTARSRAQPRAAPTTNERASYRLVVGDLVVYDGAVDTTAIGIGGVGALVGGAGAAVAAGATWQAAVNSFRAATEARDAMALAVRPSVEAATARRTGSQPPRIFAGTQMAGPTPWEF